MRKYWWLTIEEKQAKLRNQLGADEKHELKRRPYKWGAKAYLSSFDVGETRTFNNEFRWDSLRPIASKMKSMYGCEFSFCTPKREIKRIR